MIADALQRAEVYTPLHPLLRAGFDYIRHFKSETPDGKHVVIDDRVVAMPQSYITAPAAEKKFESHRRFIDIQYIVSGEEYIFHCPIEQLEISEAYSAERDVAFYRDPLVASQTLLRPGDFTIYFPEDGHKPGIAVHAPAQVRKIVMKLAV